MKLLLLFSLFVSSSLFSQISLSQWQTFQWDSALVEQTSYEPLSSIHFPRIEANENGFTISSKRWHFSMYPNLWQELHFFNSSMEFDTTIKEGVIYDNYAFGQGEDLFSKDGKIYTFNYFRACEVNDSTCNFNVFSSYDEGGNLLFSDTLKREGLMPFFNGGLQWFAETINNKVLNGDFVYYLSFPTQNAENLVSINLIRCNLTQPEIEAFPILLGIDARIYSFLNADESSILVEKRGQIMEGNRPFSLDSFSLDGELISSSLIAALPAGYTKVMDYMKGPDSNLILYRMTYPSLQYNIEFLDAGLQVESSFSIHDDDYRASPFIHPPGSNSVFMVLNSETSTQANRRLIEIDLASKSIISDTLFSFPSQFYTPAPPMFTLNEALGEVLFYGMVNGLPYIHKINVLDKSASFDIVQFPEDSLFGQCDYFHIDFNGGEYYTVAIDNISLGVGLNGYCFGKLDFPTSTQNHLKNNIHFTISPNPASHQISLLNLPAEPLGVHVLDLQGRTLYSGRSNRQSSIDLPVEQLSAGIYFVSVQGANGVRTQKFIKH
jgi:hypothetical protein